MKKRLVQALLLSAMMVSLSVSSVVPEKGHDEIIETDVAAQTETTELKNMPLSGVSNAIYNSLEDAIIRQKDVHICKVNEDTNNEVADAIFEMDKEMAEIETISDKKEYLIAYKTIVDKYSYILDPPETIYDYFTKEELDMFFRVVQAEIGNGYSFEQKCNVASVVLNRIDHYRFSDEMFEILTPDQFETISNGKYKEVEVSEDTILACEYVFMFGDTTNSALFFDSNNSLNYKFLFYDGAHNFYTLYE